MEAIYGIHLGFSIETILANFDLLVAQILLTKFRVRLPLFRISKNTVDFRYLEFQGTLWNTWRYPNFDVSDLQNWRKTNSINHI